MATDDTDSSSSLSDDDDDRVVSFHRTSSFFPTSTFAHDDTPPEKDDASSSSSSVATAELVRRIQQSRQVVDTECGDPRVLPPAAGTRNEIPNESSLPSPLPSSSPLPSPSSLDPNKDDRDDADSVDTAELVRRIRQPLSNDVDDVVDLAKIPVVDHHVRNGNVPPPLPILVEERHPHLPPGLDPRAALHTNEHDDDEFVLPEECDDDDNDNDHCMLPNVPVDDNNNNDKSQVPKQDEDDFVLPDHSEDEFVLPDQSSDDDDDDESVVPPAAVNNNVHDEFVLPDPSDNSDDDDDDSAVPDQRQEYAVVPGLQGRTDHENCQNQGKGGMVPTATTTYRTLSNRESLSNNKVQGTTATAAAQEVEPVFPGGEFHSSIENAAFGFSPPPRESRGYHTDAHSYDGNHVRTFQNSTHFYRLWMA